MRGHRQRLLDEPLHQFSEALQSVQGAGLQVGFRRVAVFAVHPGDREHRVQHGRAPRAGDPAQHLDGSVADAAPGRVDDPRQRRVVRRVVRQPQVREDVPDLPALVELDASHQAIGNGHPIAQAFDRARLGIDPVHHRNLGGVESGIGQPVDLLDDRAGLFLFVVRLGDVDPLPPVVLGPQLLRQAMVVIRDDRVRGLQDDLGGPVALVERDHLCVGKHLLELGQVARVCMTPGVDRLVRVSDHGDVAVLGR